MKEWELLVVAALGSILILLLLASSAEAQRAVQDVNVVNTPTVTCSNCSGGSSGAVAISQTGTDNNVDINGTVPVSGVFWQTTQPVSFGALPAGANTIGNVGVTNTAVGTAIAVRCVTTTGAAFESCAGGGGTGSTVDITSVNGVSPALLPVELAVTDIILPITGTISNTAFGLSSSIPAGTNNIGDVDVLTLPTIPAGNNNIGDVDIASIVPPVLTKGTQGTTGFSVQQLIDAGRNNITLSALIAAPTVADTVYATLIKASNGVAAAGTTSIVPAATKVMRLLAATMSVRTTTAATPWGQVVLRMSSTTTCTAASSVVSYFTAGGTAAVIGNTGSISVDFGNGFELPTGGSFCISISGNVTTNTVTFSAQGFEY